MEFRDLTRSCYNLALVGGKYTPRVLSCKSLDLAMDGTDPEDEILTFSGLADWKQ